MITEKKVAFAVPGKITTLTGGTIYDRRVIEGLRDMGWEVLNIELPGSFPNPSQDDMEVALAQLAEVPLGVPLIVDGLAFGALDPAGVAALPAPLVPLVHHPLAEETGLTTAQRDRLYQTERETLSKAQHVLVPSPHTARLLTDRYGLDAIDITVARPGTDPVTASRAPQSPPLILSVGIQLPRKGHDILIKALANLTDLSWQAVIVGSPLDPAHSRLLSDLRDEHGVADRLRLAGRIAEDDLKQLYTQASVFALATRYEGYGMVFDEALAHGLPIVSCAAGAVPETVPPGAGLLVPPEAPTEFAAALRHLLEDERVRQSCAQVAEQAGRALPTWLDTASTVANVLSRTKS